MRNFHHHGAATSSSHHYDSIKIVETNTYPHPINRSSGASVMMMGRSRSMSYWMFLATIALLGFALVVIVAIDNNYEERLRAVQFLGRSHHPVGIDSFDDTGAPVVSSSSSSSSSSSWSSSPSSSSSSSSSSASIDAVVEKKKPKNNPSNDKNDDDDNDDDILLMPSGVNFGSWLSLEDYFYVGRGGAVEVATPDDKIAGKCLPPLYTNSDNTGPMWHAETDLLASLARDHSLAHALRVFHAFRVAYVDWESDVQALQDLGVEYIRLPISWCLTDEDPTTIDDNDDEASLKEKFTCKDPFFDEEVLWPAIPRGFIAGFLRTCAKHGIGVTLDIHTYPGATSIGTFSGAWPRYPRFWTHGDQPATDEGQPDIGRGLLKDFIQWIESLAHTDEEAFRGLRAISPMNEPAHLAGLFDGHPPIIPKESFLPPLPPPMAESYLRELNPNHGNGTRIPDGEHLRVFLWLQDAVQSFRDSSLPSLGKEIQVNIHESVLAPDTVPASDDLDPGARHPDRLRVISSWWSKATTKEERESWAVLDMHHYHAWDHQCMGSSDGSANYTCGEYHEAQRDETLARCTSWATMLRDIVTDECGSSQAKLMSGEFSASTHHDVLLACSDATTLRATYVAQTRAAKAANIDLFYWSYKMPYGDAFRPAWSFKHFMYLMGLVPHPDESNYACG